MGNKQDLIKEIIEHELQMFLAVRSRGRAACQENPDGFRFHRDAMFSGWPEEVLSSYHKDLLEAQLEGKNLLAIKYARMENLIPVINDNEIIDKIVAIQVGWVKEMVEKYPYLHRRGRPVEEDGPDSTSTKTYLGGELETYSDLTLRLYYKYLCDCLDNGENPMQKRALAMLAGSGFDSLEAAEAAEARVAGSQDSF